MVIATSVILPAVSILLLGSTTEYWGIIYRYWAVLSTGLLLLMFLMAIQYFGEQFTKHYVYIALFTWGLCFIPLAILNSTPLCVGQDNGDGNNTFVMCGIYSIIWWFFQSFLVIPLILGLSILIQKVVRRRA